MNVLKIRNEMRSGKSIFDLPLRVTFYARVSTDKDEQLNSLENQVQYYTELIQSKPNWTYIPGYIDEGISGTSTKKRDSFLRMIADAKAGQFDFIITKEISRFSRSTLDSIQYTQELLEHDVGVLFQNDNINTLDSDSEFRLVVMAGVAQDEVRKLSERLKFGFRQAIKNGHVLGNDKLWGYDKKGCVLTINETEAKVVRRIFHLYANEQMGIRRISQQLYDEGFTSRKGNAFNVLTIRHILENPKYKGWYCANKSQTVDYRSKRKIFLDESEWVMYPDPSIPAIVSEELWDRANALYKRRSAQMMSHQSVAEFHNRYPYSGKIICEEHGTSFHRQVLKSAKGEKEVWQCRVYRNRGRAACSAPQMRTSELDQIMAQIFEQLAKDKSAIVDAVMKVIQAVPNEHDYRQDVKRVEAEIDSICAKKDRLLEMSIEGALSTLEFKQRNDTFNQQIHELERQMGLLKAEEEKSQISVEQLEKIKAALEAELSFQNGVNSALVTTILDHIVVKKGSTKEKVRLDIYLKFGDPYGVVFDRGKFLLLLHPSKKYYTQTGDQDDLISIGTIGLIKGISTFKPDKNVRLATYASRCIENEILMYFRAQRKLAGELSLSDSLDAEGDGTSLSLMDVIRIDDTMLEDLDMRDACLKIRRCVEQCLSERETMIIRLRYGLGGQQPLTQREIASLCGISRSYVSQRR